MGDEDQRSAFGRGFETLDYKIFTFAVEGAGRFIEEEDWRVAHISAGEIDALGFADAEADIALANHGVVAVWKAFDEIVSEGVLGCATNLFGCGLGAAVGDVVADRSPKQSGFLRHDGELGTPRLDLKIPEVGAVDADLAL